MTEFIFQAVTKANHANAVKELLAFTKPDKIIISTAFMNAGGLSLIEDSLKNHATKTTILAGIRNGITSAQGCKKALDLGCSLFAVDTGSRTFIFHPKIYFARNVNEARVIIGSANLTIGGLNSNIEASLLITLDMTNRSEESTAKQLEYQIESMISEYPQHIFSITEDQLIQSLLDSGRLVDESIIPAPTASGSSKNRDLDKIPRMQLKTKRIRRGSIQPIKPAAPTKKKKQTKPSENTPQRSQQTLIWESKPLTRRDLTIPTGENTNPTGSMLLKKGMLEDVEHRHYFRDTVFDDLNWHFETSVSMSHMERAETNFRFIIRNIDYGVYLLRLSHNTRTDTRSYEQRNSMTQIHWGEAKSLVAQEDLLDRTMFIYRDNTEENLFIIEID